MTLRLDALPDVQLKGHVESIAKSGASASRRRIRAKVIKLKIAIDPTKEPLRPGMRFRGQIETEKLPGVVQVPADAVFVTPEGPVAYRESGGKLERVKLDARPAQRDGDRGEAGLAPGDRVSQSTGAMKP